MHYYSHNIGDYRRDTAHLSLLEHGIYRQMLDFYYLNELPLSKDDAKLMRSLCVRTAEEQQALKNVLDDFFEATDTGYVHKRCDAVIAAFHGKSEKAKQSAEARWAKAPKVNDANAMRSHTDGNANHKPITNNHKPINTNDAKASSVKKATRLSLEAIPGEWAEWCTRNHPKLNPQATFEHFKDYWCSVGGQRGAKLDWFATWRNWCRTSKVPMPTAVPGMNTRTSNSNVDLEARGRAMGIQAAPGESYDAYFRRISQEIDRRARAAA